MPTLCKDCEHLYEETKKNPRYWMCIKHPRLELGNFVTDELRMTDPYMYCKDINGGACPLFKDKKLNET